MKKPTLIKPMDRTVDRTLCVFRNGVDGPSKARTVYDCTPALIDRILVAALGESEPFDLETVMKAFEQDLAEDRT